MADPIVHAGEGQHWYYQDGRPAYTVPSADGKRMIEPDIRHARKLGLLPGVSSILRCADKPGLTNYLIDQRMMSALTLPRRDGEPESAWLDRVKLDAEEHATKAREEGVNIHAAIQGSFEGEPVPERYEAHVAGVRARLSVLWGNSWKAEQSFASPVGYGCKIDLIGEAVIDFKTKDFKEAPTKENKIRLHWDEHAMQLAANRTAAKQPGAMCCNIFVSTSVPGLTYLHAWEEEELQRAWYMFKGLHDYWMAKNKYDPRVRG